QQYGSDVVWIATNSADWQRVNIEFTAKVKSLDFISTLNNTYCGIDDMQLIDLTETPMRQFVT
ncbi:MAG: hypothetical protein PHC53_05410, partial [Patescibacteria group bacterium]|nr:hypothetical protein [Patescibacteria group bacterium]